VNRQLPVEEKFGMITQIRRAALSVHLNIAEGASRKSEREEKGIVRYQEDLLLKSTPRWISQVILDILGELKPKILGKSTINCFKMSTGMIR